jgi:hypothetical protein
MRQESDREGHERVRKGEEKRGLKPVRKWKENGKERGKYLGCLSCAVYFSRSKNTTELRKLRAKQAVRRPLQRPGHIPVVYTID